MANPQAENGYTRIAHEILAALAVRDFSGAELRAIMVILRRSWGYQRREVQLSSQKLSTFMGVSERYARMVLSELVRKGVIELVRTPRAARAPIVRFVKDYDKWNMRPEVGSDVFGELSDPDLSLPELSDPDLSLPDLRISPFRRSGSPSSPNSVRFSPGTPTAERDCSPPSKTVKIRSKDKYKDNTLTHRQAGTNPRSLGTNPRALGTNPRAHALEPGKGIFEETEFVRTALETLYAVLGNVSPATRIQHAKKLAQAVAQHGEHVVSIALLEATREVVFKRHNEGQVFHPAGMALKNALGRVLDGARQHLRNTVAEIRKRGLEAGLRRAGNYRYAPLPGFAVPPSLNSKDTFYLQGTELARYIEAHKPAWSQELARQAGLPAGGAGPGPPLNIGRDLNDLEDPT